MKVLSAIALFVLCVCPSVIVFWLMFFKAAPALCSLVPVNEWAGILKIIIYAIVAYFGGIAIPIVLLILGISLFFKLAL